MPLILTGLTACDNVSWGGAEIRLQTPPLPQDTQEVEPPVPEGPEPLDLAPLLFLVERDDEGAVALPVAQIGPGTLRDLPTEDSVPDAVDRIARDAMAPGLRLHLFTDGARVGTFHARERAAPDTVLCNPRPRSRGPLELVPEAMGAERFLGLPEDAGRDAPVASFVPASLTADQRAASLNVAAGLFMRLGTLWPQSVLGARADVQVFRLPRSTEPLLAATFIFQDRLEVVPPLSPRSWSLFFVAEDLGQGYTSTFVRYRIAEEEGKGITRYLDHADWDGDGGQDLLLEVTGSGSRWFSAATQEGPGWRETWNETCPPGTPGTGVAAGP